MAVPTWQLRVDWDNAGDYSHAEADVTAAVIEPIHCYRGRDFNAYVSSQATPGRLTTKLANRTGKYSFFNARSPLLGTLVPGCLVQLRAFWQGTWVIRWTGYLEVLRVFSPLHAIPSCTLEASGALAYINQHEIELPSQENVLSSEVINAILDESGWPAHLRQIDAGQTGIEYYVSSTSKNDQRRKATDLLREMEVIEGGTVYEGRDGSIVEHDRHFLPSNLTAQQTFADEVAANRLYINEISYEDPLETVFSNYIADVAEFAPDTAGQEVEVWRHQGPPIEIAPGDSITIEAQYEPESGYVGVRTWGTPTYSANTSVDATGRDLTRSVSAAITPYILAARITLTNAHADAPAFVSDLAVNGIRLARASESTVSKQATAAQQGNVGQRDFPVKPKFNSADDAQRWGEWHRALFESPQPVVQITTPAFRDDAHLTAILALDISDRIALTLQGPTQAGVVEDFFVGRVTDYIDITGQLETTYDLISAGPYTGWGIVREPF